MTTTTLHENLNTRIASFKANLPTIPRKATLKVSVVAIIGSGFLACSWTGGVLGLWSLFTGTVIGFLAGILLADKFKD